MISSGKNKKLIEKNIISAAKLNTDNWWVIKNTGSLVKIRHRSTSSIRELKCG